MIGRARLGMSTAKEIQKNLGSRHWIHSIFLRQNTELMWVFDIPFAGITDEPLVMGIPEIIEHHLKKARKFSLASQYGINVLFTDAPSIPMELRGGNNTTIILDRVREDSNGAWYRDKETKMEGWLCPNLHQFFAAPPRRIYVAFR